MKRFPALLLRLCCLACLPVWLYAQPASNGIFEGTADVGRVLHPGATVFDPAGQSYRLSGAGSNIWFAKDEFHYVYKRTVGDCILQARGHLLGKGVDPHRKFGWMLRAGLDTSAAMVGAVVHGDGLTAIQYRKQAGADIEEVRSPVTMPDVIQLERRGRSFVLSVARFGEPFQQVEAPGLDLPDTLYAGLFICSHNKDVLETAEFDNVRIIRPASPDFQPYRDYIGSCLEVLDVASGRREMLYATPQVIQAPNWTTDDKALIYNSEGLMYRFDLAAKQPALIPTDFVRHNNNDHVLSADGKMLGLSSSSGEAKYGSLVYTVPVAGGRPVQVTSLGPSYLHGWSPDGKWIVFLSYLPDVRPEDHPFYRHVYLRKMPVSGGKPLIIAYLYGGQGSINVPSWSPDGKRVAFVSNSK